MTRDTSPPILGPQFIHLHDEEETEPTPHVVIFLGNSPPVVMGTAQVKDGPNRQGRPFQPMTKVGLVLLSAQHPSYLLFWSQQPFSFREPSFHFLDHSDGAANCNTCHVAHDPNWPDFLPRFDPTQ